MNYSSIIKSSRFSFYDEQRTGQLMTRITNDTFAMAELFHHGPEDIVITMFDCRRRLHYLAEINVAAYLDRLSLFANHGGVRAVFQ